MKEGLLSPRVTLTASADRGRWDAALKYSQQPFTAFHSLTWLTLAARMTDTNFTPLIIQADGLDVGVVPWLSRVRGPVSSINRMPFPYAGPIVAPELLKSTLRALGRRALATRAVKQEFQFTPGTDLNLSALHGTGFAVQRDRTYVIDTSRGEDVVWEGLEKRCRKSIRQLQRRGVVVTESESAPEVLMQFVDGLKASRDIPSGYPGVFPPDLADLRRDGLDAHWTVVSQHGTALGSLITVLFEKSAMCWFGGILPVHKSTQANVLLYWDAVQWACRQGARTFDLVGIPDAGIGLFKSQFGGSLHEYLVLTSRPPGFDSLDQLRQGLRQLRPGRHSRSSRATAAVPSPR